MTKPNRYQFIFLSQTIFNIHDYLLEKDVLEKDFMNSDFFKKNEWILKPEKSYSSCFLKLENDSFSTHLSFGDDPTQRYKVTISGKFILFSNPKNSYIIDSSMLKYFLIEKMNFIDKLNKRIDDICFFGSLLTRTNEEDSRIQNVLHEIQSKKLAEQNMFKELTEAGYSNIQKIKKDETHKFASRNEYKYFIDNYVVDKDGESFLFELKLISDKYQYSIKNNDKQVNYAR